MHIHAMMIIIYHSLRYIMHEETLTVYMHLYVLIMENGVPEGHSLIDGSHVRTPMIV